MQALKEDPKKMRRITFNEITKTAVKNSIKQPRELDMNLVDAQQARRMLDRMVGYSISPLLWAKVKRGLSAGRVQSVALRIICDREEEINSFIPEEYWSLDGEFKIQGEKKHLQAKFYGTDKKLLIHNKAEIDEILKKLEHAEYEIKEVKKGERIKNAPLPFTTSTLQQEAAKTLKDVYKRQVDTIKKLPTYHAVIFARNETGRINLYKLVSQSHLKYYRRRPRVPKSVFLDHREGLLIGSACEAGELYQAILRNAPDQEIARLVDFHDYLEIQPLGNNAFTIASDKNDAVNLKAVSYTHLEAVFYFTQLPAAILPVLRYDPSG